MLRRLNEEIGKFVDGSMSKAFWVDTDRLNDWRQRAANLEVIAENVANGNSHPSMQRLARSLGYGESVPAMLRRIAETPGLSQRDRDQLGILAERYLGSVDEAENWCESRNASNEATP